MKEAKFVILEKPMTLNKGNVYIPIPVEEDGFVLLNLDDLKMGTKVYPDLESIKEEFNDSSKYIIKDKDFAWLCRFMWLGNGTI